VVDADVVVVGAGPAGLATAGVLSAAGRRPVVVERGDGVAAAWRGRYDSFRLHTIRWLSQLPGMPIPRPYGRWVARDDLVRYLESYGDRFGLSPRFGVDVRKVERVDGSWRLLTSTGPLTARSVIVATGYSNVPYVPDWPGLPGFGRPLIHSAQYRNPAPYRGMDVLVVGCGNSGAEIALDLLVGGAARVRVAVRTPPNIVRRTSLGVPSQLLGIALRSAPPAVMDPLSAVLRRVSVPDLAPYGLPAPAGDGFTQFLRTRTVPIIDTGFVAAVRARRLEIVSGVAALDGEEVLHMDGSRSRSDAVVAATGYRPGLKEMLDGLGILDGDGLPVVTGARTVTAAPGLYLVGMAIRLSGLLREIAIEARQVAATVVAR
jgi:putative flavoprotein involved in K+ transport